MLVYLPGDSKHGLFIQRKFFEFLISFLFVANDGLETSITIWTSMITFRKVGNSKYSKFKLRLGRFPENKRFLKQPNIIYN